MEFTGERPTIDNEDEIKVSKIRYHSILPFCINKSIADLGCGVGHGTYYLSSNTNKDITGYDICEEAIIDARSLFIRSNLNFKSIKNFDSINLKDIDLLTMVESFEHFDKNEADLLLKRCSTINTLSVALTTPNGDQFNYHPQNSLEYRGYHKWHYTLEELLSFKKYFRYLKVYADVYDPILKAFTSYILFASNSIKVTLPENN